VILSESQSTAQSDVNGVATLVPSAGSFGAPLEIQIQVSAGTAAALQDEMEIIQANDDSGNTSPTFSPWQGSAPARRRLPLFWEH